ncbi:hypothetical protein K0M31_002486 [Melipona bicolor]|uniref:Uncharacterized protein n=1 Tax=Melipona bicolor TaxID=60889 RepID=A0AA40GIN2_9HYME|nr:hypothetical protein K0M31_002486 [Melipona bicolor]
MPLGVHVRCVWIGNVIKRNPGRDTDTVRHGDPLRDSEDDNNDDDDDDEEEIHPSSIFTRFPVSSPPVRCARVLIAVSKARPTSCGRETDRLSLDRRSFFAEAEENFQPRSKEDKEKFYYDYVIAENLTCLFVIG